MDCVHILYEHICHGQEVPPVVCHVTGLHLGEEVGDEALKVSIILQCHMSSSAGFFGETRISQNLKVLPRLISQVGHEPPLYQLTQERLIHEPQATQPPLVMLAFQRTIDGALGNNSSRHKYIS
ncbi:hypothetical protein NHX12_028172 [Muraenolepis orangiensis]|uniref:Uncharacterized protein n=1 Tax=Muraenolepis orangiensis TaxID=630683 RepID=A0A9Q0D945_9TELE|nr:hypothetical protein NHX12_028172 [Muraenolepis orangiensis]